MNSNRIYNRVSISLISTGVLGVIGAGCYGISKDSHGGFLGERVVYSCRSCDREARVVETGRIIFPNQYRIDLSDQTTLHAGQLKCDDGALLDIGGLASEHYRVTREGNQIAGNCNCF